MNPAMDWPPARAHSLSQRYDEAATSPRKELQQPLKAERFLEYQVAAQNSEPEKRWYRIMAAYLDTIQAFHEALTTRGIVDLPAPSGDGPIHSSDVEGRSIDLAREHRIRVLQDAINHAPDRSAARSIWPMLRAEINARSAYHVSRMERERGLA